MRGEISTTRRFWLLGVLAIWVALAWPGSSQAAVTCTFSGGHARVDMSSPNDSVGFVRSGSFITLVSGIVYPPVDRAAIQCAGGPVTVENTDSVSVVQGPDSEDQAVGFDLHQGPFAPGATPEADGSSEIEFELDVAGDSQVVVDGTDGPDNFSVAPVDPTHFGVDLSAAGSPEAGAPDVKLGSVLDLGLFAEGGVDTIDGSAVPNIRSRRTYLVMTMVGGADPDRLVAGGPQSHVHGGSGRDLLYGSSGVDILSGGRGRDLMFGGRGKDSVESVDGKRDRIQCGASKDRVLADRRDKVKRCERVLRRGAHRFPILPDPSSPFAG